MVTLVSPEYSLVAFCYQMIDKDPVEIMEVASAEITYARRLHTEKTGETAFRKGSKGRLYSEQLQCLIRLLMGGSIPQEMSAEFIADVRPLVRQLLKKYEIGELRQKFSDRNA